MWRSGEDPEKETENEHTLMQAEIKKEKLAMESNASISQVRLKKKKTIELKNMEVFADHDKSSFSE